jgi:hypothetical protein
VYVAIHRQPLQAVTLGPAESLHYVTDGAHGALMTTSLGVALEAVLVPPTWSAEQAEPLRARAVAGRFAKATV